MKKVIYLIVVAAAVSLTTSCRMSCKKGSGEVTSDSRKVANFDAIHVKGAYKVILRQDSSNNLKITTDNNLLEYIEASVSGGTLEITSDKNICASQEAVIEVGVRNLKQIEGAGAVKFVTEGQLHTSDIALKLDGSGSVDLNLNAAKVSTVVNGSSEINLKGQAASHVIKVAGTGKLRALDFVVGDYTVETTGASDCQINVLKSLTVDTKGAADIQYRGNPASVKNNETGSSNLKKIN